MIKRYLSKFKDTVKKYKLVGPELMEEIQEMEYSPTAVN